MLILSSARLFAERFSVVDCLFVLSAAYLSTLSNIPPFEIYREHEHLGFLRLTNLPPKPLGLS